MGFYQELNKKRCSDKALESNDAVDRIDYIAFVYYDCLNKLSRISELRPIDRAVRHFMKTGFQIYARGLLCGKAECDDRSLVVSSVTIPINETNSVLNKLERGGVITRDQNLEMFHKLRDVSVKLVDDLFDAGDE